MKKLEFEFDPNKSQANKNNHGIALIEAQALWLDFQKVEIPAQTKNELRFVVIGKMVGKHWSAVITYREANIRIISVRRSRPEEVKIYES